MNAFLKFVWLFFISCVSNRQEDSLFSHPLYSFFLSFHLTTNCPKVFINLGFTASSLYLFTCTNLFHRYSLLVLLSISLSLHFRFMFSLSHWLHPKNNHKIFGSVIRKRFATHITNVFSLQNVPAYSTLVVVSKAVKLFTTISVVVRLGNLLLKKAAASLL